MSQLSFLNIAQRRKKLRCEKFLDEMNTIIPWNRLCSVILPHYKKGTGIKGGRPAMSLLLMLKIYCLQQWYNLSDPSVEEAIYDRNSFQKFLKIDLLSDNVPDETTILNFRHTLEHNNLCDRVFKEINKYLEEKNLLLYRGTIVDASLIESHDSTKNKTKSRDSEMSSTRKNGKYHFGMKAHIGVDSKSGLTHSVDFTTAKINDIQRIDNLLHGKEKAIFGDKGYVKKQIKKDCRSKGIFYGILSKNERYHKISSKQEKRNKQLSSVRAKVEHPFRILKCIWNYNKTKYRGIKKNADNLTMIFGLINLYIVRKKLLLAG